MQKLQLSIPEPCHENWQNMAPTEQGRYCKACAKEVVDFSMMTDTELLNYFATISYEKVCGRALPGQLERTISRPKDPKKRLFWYWNYIVMFFMFFSKANNVKAQVDVKAVTEISNVPVDKLGETMINSSRVIIGKVTDIDGIPVSFATIKIKGSLSGLSADANGAYSIRVNPNDVLIISGASFKSIGVPVGSQPVLNTVLEKAPSLGLMEVIVTGGISLSDLDYNFTQANPKYTASIQVKDDDSGLPIDKARISFTKKYTKDPDTAFTDKRGVYKLKRIKEFEEYDIKVEADGYESNEFTINGNDFNERKKLWEVLLRKQKVELTKSEAVEKPGVEKIIIRLRCENSAAGVGPGALYVVDGTILPNGSDINPDDVEDYSILQGPAAAAIFGPDGSNGAIIITTKKSKIESLDTVTIAAEAYRKKRTLIICSSTVMGSMIKGVSVRNTIIDSAKIIAAKINGAIKIYPNPVQRGDQINISLKLKQTGPHQIQIFDASGKIVLQKQIIAVAKDHIEKIPADNRWSGGVYYIRVFENNNKLISTNSFIVR